MANKVILAGNVGKEPEIHTTGEGVKIGKFNIATRNYKDGSDWHRVVCFGKVADLVETYVNKGTKLYIEGRLQTRDFEDKQGVKRYVTEVVMEQMEFMGSKNDAPSSVTQSASDEEPDVDLPF